MALVGDYSSSSSEEEEEVGSGEVQAKNTPRRIVEVNALRRLAGEKVLTSRELDGKDDKEEEEQETLRRKETQVKKESRSGKGGLAASLKAFLPAPKHSMVQESRGEDETQLKKKARTTPNVRPLASQPLRTERIPPPAQEKEYGDTDPTIARVVAEEPELKRSYDLGIQEHKVGASQREALPLPESVLRELERDGVVPDDAILEVRQADQFQSMGGGNDESARSREQGYVRARLSSVASGSGGVQAASKTQKRKSQITFLAADLAAKQADLEEKRRAGQRTKRETWAKYGW